MVTAGSGVGVGVGTTGVGVGVGLGAGVDVSGAGVGVGVASATGSGVANGSAVLDQPRPHIDQGLQLSLKYTFRAISKTSSALKSSNKA
jgi:hypothetical protein